MNQIYVLVIIYNRECKKSETLACLQKIKHGANIKLNIILVDNSTQLNKNDDFCNENDITYISMNGNYGLAKAYNKAVEYIASVCNAYTLCVFDDDTILTTDYFKKLSNVLRKVATNTIFLPMIYDTNGLLSPSLIKNGLSVKRSKVQSDLDLEKITGINTGMAITGDVFKKVRYNEDMFLDYIDHEFIRDAKEKKVNIEILDTTLKQNFFDNEKSNFNTAFIRYKLFLKDFKIFCRDHKFFYFFQTLKRGLKLSLKYNHYKFITKLFHKN